MNKTIKETDKYKLIRGIGQARGCYRILRTSDNAVTDWNTGSEGQQWAILLDALPDNEFNAKCETFNYK